MPQLIPLIVAAGAYEAGAEAITIALLSVISSVAVSIYEKEEAEAQARAAARAALQDRLITIRSGISPRQYVFGHARTGGAQLYIETTGNKQEALDTVTAFAANVCQMTDWFLADDRMSVAQFPGSKYGRQTNVPASDVFTVTGPTANVVASSRISASYPVTGIPLGGGGLPVPIPLHATWRKGTSTGAATAVNTTGLNVTLTGLPTGSSVVTLSYQTPQDAFLRGQFKSGTNTQTPTNWSGYTTPGWDATHRLAGTAHVRTLYIWDSNAYQNGAPAVTGAFIGRAIDGIPFYDPRDGSNPTDTSNPAILAGYWLTLPRIYGGMGIPFDWVDWSTVAAAATICDELVAVKTLDGTGFETITRYSCDTVLSTDIAPRDNLLAILSSMAGTYAFTCGKYRIFAGAFRPAAITITDNDVVGTKSISVNTAASTDTPPNIVTATFSDANQDWVSSSPTAVTNTDYIAADGFESPLDLQLKATTDARRARYLMGIALERGRPAFGITLSIGGIGENIGLYDTVQLNLTNRSVYAGKTFEIASITDNWDGTFQATLSEIKATTFALDPDTYTPITPVVPADNSYLWSPPAPTSFVVTTITPTKLPDGTSVTRVSLAWDPIPPAGNTPGAFFNIRYRTTGGAWIGAAPVPGDATSTVLTTALQDGEMYQFEIQFVNGIGAASDWVDAYTGIAGTPLPTPLSLRLAASSLIFRVPETGNALPASITLKAVRSGGLMGTAVFTTSPSVTLTGSGDTRVLLFEDAIADSILVTVTVTSGSDVYTDTQTISKVYDGASQAPDFTPPPTPTGLSVSAFLITLVVNWDQPSFTEGGGYDSTVVYAAVVPSSGPQPTFAQAVPVGSSSTSAFAYSTTTGTKVAFWIKNQSKAGVRSTLPAGGTNGVQAQTGVINGVDLAPGLIDASKLADGSVTAAKLAAASIDNTKLANGLQTVKVITGTLPATNVSNVIFRTDDGKLYKWNGATYTAATLAADVQGQLTDAQIAAVGAAKLTGTLNTTQIGPNTVQTANLAAAAVTAAQIAADTITAANIAANAITASELAANAVTAGKIAANAVTAGTIAAAAVSAAQIAAGAITTDKLLVTGRGAALNDDPSTSDASAWIGVNAGFQIATINDGVAGTTSMRSPSGQYGGAVSRHFALDPTKAYRVRAQVRNVGGDGIFYLLVSLWDSNGSEIPGDGSFWFYPASGVIPPAGFTIYTGVFGAGTARPFPALARKMACGVLLNYIVPTTGYMEAQDLRIEQVMDSSLIVDGAITATKLAAGSIAVGTAAIQNGAIVNAMIGAAAIDSAKIADASITSAKIANATIVGADIASATIATANIAAAAITSALIANAAITNAKIGNLEVDSAKIANLTIGTGKIGDNAVTGSATGSAGAQSSVNGNIISFNYTSVGGTIIIFVQCGCNALGNTTAAASLLVDGTTEASDSVTASVSVPASLEFRQTVILDPAAGVHTIVLHAVATTFTGGNIIVIELKK